MVPTTAAELVDRALRKNKEARSAGSVWRLGRLALTTTDGQLTDVGNNFLARRPEVDLPHYNRASERITGRQVRVTDMLGRERIVAKMTDGKVVATKSGQSYYGAGSSVFQAYVPVWRRDAQGTLFRTSIPLDDEWRRLTPGAIGSSPICARWYARRIQRKSIDASSKPLPAPRVRKRRVGSRCPGARTPLPSTKEALGTPKRI